MRYLSHSDYLLDLPYSFDWEHDKEFIIVELVEPFVENHFVE